MLKAPMEHMDYESVRRGSRISGVQRDRPAARKQSASAVGHSLPFLAAPKLHLHTCQPTFPNCRPLPFIRAELVRTAMLEIRHTNHANYIADLFLGRLVR